MILQVLWSALVAGSLLAAEVGVRRAGAEGPPTRLEFLGEARLRGERRVGGTVVGGLSGITYDRVRDLYYVVSDDPSSRAPARFYSLTIDLEEGRLNDAAVRLRGVTPLRDAGGRTLAKRSVDAEGISLLGDELFISSEGQIDRGVAPFVRRYRLDGILLRELELPDRYQPRTGPTAGPRHNFVFESLTLTPDHRFLFTATENALKQDGPAADVERPSPSRVLKFDLAAERLVAEYLYWTEPVAAVAAVPNGLQAAGLVELLALDEERLLALERSFSMGVGNTIRLFEVTLSGATDVSSQAALRQASPQAVRAAAKELILDFEDLGIDLDNLEGMCFGPRLADGRQTLVLVGDDNFNPPIQVTQFLAFALSDEPVELTEVQGAAHRSPLENQWVRGVSGVVTAMETGADGGFWIEQPGGPDDRWRSTGLFVDGRLDAPVLARGDLVRVAGRVLEQGSPGDLPTTILRPTAISILARDRPLPAPVRLGASGRQPPSEVVDDDSLQHFDPSFDGIDFWESLEGMRVVVAAAEVVGPTDHRGQVAVVPGGGPRVAGRSQAGGLLLRPGDDNPERLTLDFGWLPASPAADVGDRFDGELAGILDYKWGRYRLRCLDPLPPLVTRSRAAETTRLAPVGSRLTVATFNVRNLSALSEVNRFVALARTLVSSLRAPDIVALQEIQDDSGDLDDGTVTAERTLGRLIDAVVSAGGPRYEYRQIDPEDRRDGGQPGANIRVAFLVDPERVELVDRGSAGSREAVRVVRGADGPHLSLSPGRVAPQSAAFEGDERRGFAPGRKSLAVEVEFAGRRLFLINNHWASKTPDSGVFGSQQPPMRRSEDQRSQQARQIGDFVQSLLAVDPQAGVIVLGDLNDHEFRAPLRVLARSGLVSLVERLPEADRYTFNYRGNSQVLDHVLLSPGLADRARVRVDIVHLNADFAEPHRASDHDPVLVELDLSAR